MAVLEAIDWQYANFAYVGLAAVLAPVMGLVRRASAPAAIEAKAIRVNFENFIVQILCSGGGRTVRRSSREWQNADRHTSTLFNNRRHVCFDPWSEMDGGIVTTVIVVAVQSQ